MNSENDSFEKLLKAQPLRPIPSDWREAVLPDKTPGRSWSDGWRALAACWCVILILQALTPSLGTGHSSPVSSSAAAFQQSNFQLAMAVIRSKNDSN